MRAVVRGFHYAEDNLGLSAVPCPPYGGMGVGVGVGVFTGVGVGVGVSVGVGVGVGVSVGVEVGGGGYHFSVQASLPLSTSSPLTTSTLQ